MLHKYFYSEKSKGMYFQYVPADKPSDTAIIFLHGLTGSHRSWGEGFYKLRKNVALYFVDLIGLGFSAKPDIAYTLEDHIQYIHKFINKNVPEKKIILVGHSMGALIALTYTAKYPGTIQKAFLISLPYYYSREEAITHIKGAQPFKYFAIDSPVTHFTCLMICTVFGSLSRQIMPLFNPHVPRKIVQDYFRHSYKSVMRTLQNVVYAQNVPVVITSKTSHKLVFIHGAKDKTCPVSHVEELANKYNIPLFVSKNGTHHLPIFESEFAREVIEKEP